MAVQNELAAEREQRKAVEQQARDDAAAAQRQVETDRLTAELRRTYLSAPGVTEDDFQRDLPEMLRQRARDAAPGGGPTESVLSTREILAG